MASAACPSFSSAELPENVCGQARIAQDHGMHVSPERCLQCRDKFRCHVQARDQRSGDCRPDPLRIARVLSRLPANLSPNRDLPPSSVGALRGAPVSLQSAVRSARFPFPNSRWQPRLSWRCCSASAKVCFRCSAVCRSVSIAVRAAARFERAAARPRVASSSDVVSSPRRRAVASRRAVMSSEIALQTSDPAFEFRKRQLQRLEFLVL